MRTARPLLGSALGLVILATTAHAQPPRTGGMVGAFQDPGSGVLVSGEPGGKKVEAIFEVGRAEQAPYAREQVTLAPTGKRTDRTLSVTYNYQVKRAAAKIPGGLGAFWEMDLQSEEGALLRDVYLLAGGHVVQATAKDGSHADFPLASAWKAPYTVLFTLQFFKRAESFRFTLDDAGNARYVGTASKSGSGGAGGGDASGGDGPLVKEPPKLDPALPKRDQPPTTFSKTPPRAGATAAKVEPPRLAAPAGWQDKRGTWLTPTEIRDRAQDLTGLWVDADAEGQTDLVWLRTPTATTLKGGTADARVQDLSFMDLKKAGGQWKGLVHVCPRPAGTCPNLCGWVPGVLQVDAANLYARGEWHGKKSKSDCTGNTNDPDDGPLAFKRFIGVTFVPLLPGKYMHLIAAPAVGNQPGQFKAGVRLAARYAGTGAADVKVSAKGGTLTVRDKNAGTYDFLADRSGVCELTFELVGADGQVFHTDRARIEIPSIPGLGN